ncbi:phage tail spike protein, partial [Lactococcus lactis]
SHNIKWYFDQLGLINFAKISLGINQVKNDTRVINYDSEDTKLARLISVIQNFDAEFEFVTKLKRDGTLDNITLNIYKKNDGGDIQGVGQNRNDVLLSFGENVMGVNRKVEKSQIFNSLYVTGKDGLSWKDSAWSVTNSEGQEEFYKRAGESYAKAPLSAQMFPSQLQSSTGDIFTNKNASTEYTTVNAMWGYALSQLKQYAYPLVTYEVTATSNLTVSSTGDGMPLHIGDTVRIQDKNFIDSDGNVGLFLSARVSELEISFTNPTSNKIMFSNYIKLKSEVSDDLTARMQEIINANTPYRPDITSTNGLQFKNGTGTTTLGAHIYFGSDDKETIADSYSWSKDGTVVANAQTITVDASGVADKAVYSFKATVGGKVVANQSVTITNVDDGTNGRSVTNVSQKWRLTTTTATPTQAWSDAGWLTTQPTTTATNKYLWSITRTTFNLAPLTQDVIEQKAVYGDKGDKGDTGNDGRAGKDGVGINSTTITYAISSSGTVTPTAGWTSQVPTLVKGQYLWTKTVWNYSDGTSESGYTVSYIAKDGNNGNDGIAGKDGTGIKKTTITYAVGTSGTTAPASGWNSQVPNVPAGQYLWTKTVWDYTDKTSETGYSVSKFGEKGDKGDQGVQGIQGVDGRQGIPGPKGADGKTQYTHIAYANSADGVTDFSTSDSNRTYIGMYVDFNINDSTTPSDYSWTLVKGADGTQGTPGKPGADGKTPYFHTAWSYSADGTDGFTTVYPNLNLFEGSKKYTKDNPKILSSSATDGWTTVDDVIVKNLKAGTYTMSAKADAPWTVHDTSGAKQGKVGLWLVSSTWEFISLGDTVPKTIEIHKDGDYFVRINTYSNGKDIETHKFWDFKLEPGSTATPHMPSASEAKTSDWPSYIGQYSDFTQADSTNPSAYTWSLIRGNDGERGPQGLKGDPGATGIPGQPGADGKTSYLHIAYATNSTGTVGFDVSNATGKTYIGQYTDFTSADSTDPSKYTWSLIKGDKGDRGNTGPEGPAGSNGNPGKIVSDTEPTTRFKGLTWKYLGTSDLTASDGTVILSGTEYYWSGTNWILSEINAHNINGDNLNVTNGTFTDGVIETSWKNGPVAGSTNIEKDHLIITRTDSSINTTNSIGLDSTQGLIMVYTENSTGRTISVGTNFQGMSLTDSTGISASISPAGVKLSSDVNWTQIGNIGGRRAEWKRENNRVTMNIHG